MQATTATQACLEGQGQATMVMAASWGSRLIGYPGERLSVLLTTHGNMGGPLSIKRAFHGVVPSTLLSGARGGVATIAAGQVREIIPVGTPMRDAMTGTFCALFNSALQPINVWKTKLQSSPTGHSFGTVVRSTPLRDLYAGTVAIFARNGVWQAVNAQVYGQLREEGDSYIEKTGKQIVSSTAATVACHPLQVAAVVQANAGIEGPSLIGAVKQRFATGGVRGLFAGVTPAVGRIWVCSLVMAPVSDYLTKK